MSNPLKATTFHDRIEQWHVAKSLVQLGVNKYRQYKSELLNRTRYFLSIEEDEMLYEEVLKWLYETLDPNETRIITVETQREYRDDQNFYNILLYAGGEFKTSVMLEGDDIAVAVTTKKAGEQKKQDDQLDGLLETPDEKKMSAMYQMASGFSMSKRITFTCENIEQRDVVVRHLRKIADGMSKREPSFWVAASYGGWKKMGSVRRRPLDSVVLEGNKLKNIVNDLNKFLGEEDRYIELGLPWHHGYLLHGPPGTGKTSLATVLASEFGFDLYYLPLSSIETDAKLLEIFTAIESKKAFLVLEDVDTVTASHNRDKDSKGITMGGLLNCLDGITTPHGLVLVMTTNEKPTLDKALTRPGRVDMDVEITYVTDDQLRRLCKRFIGEELELPALGPIKITPAEVVGVFKESDPSKVKSAILKLLYDAAEKLSQDGVQLTV